MAEDSVLRVGVAGLGKMGLVHSAIYNSLSGCQLAAAADPASFPKNILGNLNPSVRMFSDTEEMLSSENLDAVIITTPVATHVPLALRCIEQGIPFFVEKPLAASSEQGEELLSALREKPTLHMVGFMTRYVDAFEKGYEIINSGCLGKVHRVTATIYVSQLFSKGKGWRYDRKVAGGGVLLSQGAHLLDLLTWYFGPVARVNAQVQPVYSEEIEDFAHVMLEFQSGLHGWVDSSWSVRFRRTVEITIDILAENGSLVLGDDSVRLFLDDAAGGFPAGWSNFNAAELFRGVEVDIGGPQYTREDQDFLDVMRNGKQHTLDAGQGLHIQKIIDASYSSSLQNGAPQEITA